MSYVVLKHRLEGDLLCIERTGIQAGINLDVDSSVKSQVFAVEWRVSESKNFIK